MAWLYIPGLEASNLDSRSLCPGIERSVTLNGKHTQRRLLLRAWTKKSWMKRLSGMMLKPSTARRGAERWILSLPDSHVNLFQLRESVKDIKINVGSGLRSGVSFAKFDQASCSWRTYRGSSLTSPELLPTLPRSAIGGRMGFFLLPDAERVKYENDGFFWPTSRTTDAHGPGWHGQGGMDLRTAARMWSIQMWASATITSLHNRKGASPTSGDGLATQARAFLISFHQDETNLENGGLSWLKTRHLNQKFVEWLFGLPIGWTDCERSVTQSFQSWLRKHGVSCWHVYSRQG